MNGAWKCIMVMPNLLLQKPAANSKAKDYKNALEGIMLVLWKNGEFLSLLKEVVKSPHIKFTLHEILLLLMYNMPTF